MINEKCIALVGGVVIDGKGEDPIRDGIVVIKGSIIQAVGIKNKVGIPKNCEVIDISGKTLMPGMIDCHCHLVVTGSVEERLFTPNSLTILRAAEMAKRALQAGFTTLRDAGGIPDVGIRKAVAMGLIEGPRLILAGPIAQTGGHFDEYFPSGVELSYLGFGKCDGISEVQKGARDVLRRGFDFIKVCTSGGIDSPTDSPEYTEWSMEELKAVTYEASARGKSVMAHAEGTRGIKNAIQAGVWSVEHGSMLDEEAVQMFLASGTYLVPTLSVFMEISQRGKELGLSEISLAKAKKMEDFHAKSFKMAIEAGVKIATGSDAFVEQMHGQNARELELMVRYGYTPMQAILAATKISSEVCCVDDIVGTLEPEKNADILVIDGNPLDDISILQDKSRILVVMKDGICHWNKIL